MFEWLSAFEFSQVAWLWLGAFAPLLVLAYLKKKPPKKKIVSSVLLLRSLTKQRVAKRKLKLPLRFFLELLSLLLLAVAATEPLVKDHGKRTAILVDNSLSMRARRSSDVGEKQSRFDEAQLAIKDWVKKQKTGNHFTLFASSPRLLQIGGENLLGTEITKLCESITPVLSGDALGTSISELAQSRLWNEMVIVSDRRMEKESSPSVERGGHSPIEIHSLQTGKPVANVFLSSLRISKGDSVTDSARTVTVGFGFSGQNAVDVSVELNGEQRGKEKEKTSNTPIARKETRISSDKMGAISLEVPEKFRNIHSFQVKLHTNSTPSGGNELSPDFSQNNALLEDDLGWISDSGATKTKLLLVTPERQPSFFGLPEIFHLEIFPQDNQTFKKLSSSDLRQFALVLFYQTAPTFWPEIPTLLVLPPSENTLVPVFKEVNSLAITSWASEHPLTSYLRVPLLTPRQALIFSPPFGAQAVINAQRGPILVAGERNGVRYAAVGFEVFPFEGIKTPAISVLTLNLLQWLSQKTEQDNMFLTGSSLRLDGNRNWVIRKPNGKILEKASTDGAPVFLSLEEPGIYQVRGLLIGRESRVEKTGQDIAVNPFFPEESETFIEQTYQVPQSIEGKVPTLHNSKKPAWPTFLQLALGILLLELVLRVIVLSRASP